jgi:hypothetical protein
VQTIQCRVCGQGYLYTVKVHRLSGPAVSIGYILLMPSLLGIVLCLGFILATWIGAFAYPGVAPQTLQGLEDTNVPGELRQSLKAGHRATEAEMASLTSEQERQVQRANGDIEMSQLGSGCFAACGTGIALIGAVLSFMGGLFGWLLVMRKRVLMCNFCRATIDAS